MKASSDTAATAAQRSSRSSWRRHLDGLPAALDLPSDRHRGEGGERSARCPAPGVVEAATAFSDASGVPVVDVLTAAFAVLAARQSGQGDVVVGVLPPGRVGGAFDVLRQSLADDATVSSLLAGVAASRSTMPGPATVDDILAAIGASSGDLRHPVFQLLVRHADAPTPPSRHPPPDAALVWSAQAASIDYRADLFEAWRVEGWARQLRLILRGFGDPAVAIWRLPLVEEAEAASILGLGTGAEADVGVSFTRRLGDIAASAPGLEAVVSADGTAMTYAELDRLSDDLARRLVAAGAGPGQPVAIATGRSARTIAAVVAAWKAGAAYVPVDPAYPAARRALMLETAEVAVAVADAPAALGAIAATVVDPTTTTEEDGTLVLPGETGEGLGYVIFTSGSTGRPKGVRLPRRALANLVDWQVRRPHFAPGARVLQFASLSFDVSFQEIATTLATGGTLVLVAEGVRRDATALLHHVAAFRVRRLFLPFVALRGLADAANATGAVLPDLAEVYTAGEQLVVDGAVRAFFERHPGCLLENQYGPSETHVVTAHRLTGPASAWPALPPVGRPVDNAVAVVLDRFGALQPLGVPGELHVGGACLADGYARNPELTAERFREHVVSGRRLRLYATGDVARLGRDGAIEYLGRTDAQVKFRGYRVEPGEIAAVLSGHPAVAGCVCAVAPVSGAGPRLAAWIVPREGGLDLVDLARFAREALPDYMVPSHLVTVDALPTTPSGKVDMAALPVPSFDRAVLGSRFAPPSSDAEVVLAEIWRDLLGVGEIGRDDDFFELGGDSLVALEMMDRVRARFGRDLPLGALAGRPTVAGLAGLLGRAGAGVRSFDPLVPLTPGTAPTPLFCVHGGSGNVASFPRLAQALGAGQPVYALQWDGLGGTGGTRTIDAMARLYVDRMRTVQPRGPYLLAGQCIGGLVARAMAAHLAEAGERVELLVMYESPNVWSRHFLTGLPAVRTGAGLARPARRVYGFLARWILAPPMRAKRQIRMRALDLLGRPQRFWDRQDFGSLAMIRAVWRHAPREAAAPTLYLHTGLASGAEIALAGRWTDGALGWSDHAGPDFTLLEVEATHNGVPYAEASVAALKAHLAAAHERIAASGSTSAASAG